MTRVSAGLVALALVACSKQDLVDSVVDSSYQPAWVMPTGSAAPVGDEATAGLRLLAGDAHCHVSPPDADWDVSRDLDETVTLARREGLDFVILTPHVPARFFADADARAWVKHSQADLRERVAAAPTGDIVFIPGFEYTDHQYGHVGASFADLDAVLADVPLHVAQEHPERFFERWVERGGMLVVNHPFVTPLDSVFRMARYDLSWRPLTARGPFPAEIEAVDRLAQGWEAFNLTATELRDQILLGDRGLTVEKTLAAIDARVAARRKRIAAVGGSDSHGHYLRATTFVWARDKSPAAIRDAFVAGRTCVRDPAACSLEARAPGGAWRPVGAAVDGVDQLEVRARGDKITLLRDGEAVARPSAGEIVAVPVARGRCSAIRAVVGEGYSSAIWANCGIGVVPAPTAPPPTTAAPPRPAPSPGP